MKIAYYCQHVLGIGHFHRSLEICLALAEHHEVILIVGGPDINPVPEQIRLIQLPGLQMDAQFKNLTPCDPNLQLEEVKELRKNRLIEIFEEEKPEVFLVELYPFGRKAFRFELDPVLKAIKSGQLQPCSSYVSLRDILVERPNDKEKFENRIIKTLTSSFDGLLIHSDPEIITLDETFDRYDDIPVSIAYTGFVTKKTSTGNREVIRKSLKLTNEDKLIIASIGGGNVGRELLEATVTAFSLLSIDNLQLQIFSGPYFKEQDYQKLQKNLPANCTLDRFSNRFPDLLQAADLSISMAGYNTCMNLLHAGIPSLVYPFAQNREQHFRATRLSTKAPITVLDQAELAPHKLASHIKTMLGIKRQRNSIDLNGAINTRVQIETWYSSTT